MGDGNQLCDKIRQRPYSLVLFDEIEKAHPDVFNIMLQILGDGRLTDSKGRVTYFKNALIIMTSNIGAKEIQQTITGGGGMGFQPETKGDATYERLKKELHATLMKFFKPEFINRLDDTIVFKPLDKPDLEKVSDLELQKLYKRIRKQYEGMTVELTKEFKEKLLKEGYAPKYGARPLRRAITRLVQDELSSSVMLIPPGVNETVVLDLGADGKIMVNRTGAAPEETKELFNKTDYSLVAFP